MEDLSKFLVSVSTLLWPLIVIGILVAFRPVLGALLDSAKSRKFTLKIGGQELTMEEASVQQRTLIADLQSQIAELRQAISSFPHKALAGEERRESKPLLVEPAHPSILWVDDHPKNNSYFIEQLGEVGISVDLALSTDEGLAKFKSGSYQAVISDMGRREDGKERPEAGIELLEKIRKIDAQIPYLIFCSYRGVERNGEKAKQAGVTAITSSPSELFSILNLDTLRKRP